MRIEVFYTPGEFGHAELTDRTAVVVDVLRATSTMVEALANGARAIFPVQTIDDAVRLVQNLGRDGVLLCGERRGERVEGFDLGNSPLEFTPERVGEKTLVMTTTNGTSALLAAAKARRALVFSFLNLDAVVADLLDDGGDVVVLCAGREGRFALEDVLAAGSLVRAVRERADVEVELNEAAVAAEYLAGRTDRSLEAQLRDTEAGRNLMGIGHGDDIAVCAQVNRRDVVPRLTDRKVTLP